MAPGSPPTQPSQATQYRRSKPLDNQPASPRPRIIAPAVSPEPAPLPRARYDVPQGRNPWVEPQETLISQDILYSDLASTGGNRTCTAELLGMSRRAPLYKIKRYDL